MLGLDFCVISNAGESIARDARKQSAIDRAPRLTSAGLQRHGFAAQTIFVVNPQPVGEFGFKISPSDIFALYGLSLQKALHPSRSSPSTHLFVVLYGHAMCPEVRASVQAISNLLVAAS